MTKLFKFLSSDDKTGFTIRSAEGPGVSSSAANAAEARRIAKANLERVLGSAAAPPRSSK